MIRVLSFFIFKSRLSGQDLSIPDNLSLGRSNEAFHNRAAHRRGDELLHDRVSPLTHASLRSKSAESDFVLRTGRTRNHSRFKIDIAWDHTDHTRNSSAFPPLSIAALCYSPRVEGCGTKRAHNIRNMALSEMFGTRRGLSGAGGLRNLEAPSSWRSETMTRQSVPKSCRRRRCCCPSASLSYNSAKEAGKALTFTHQNNCDQPLHCVHLNPSIMQSHAFSSQISCSDAWSSKHWGWTGSDSELIWVGLTPSCPPLQPNQRCGIQGTP